MSKPVFEDIFRFSGRRNRKSYILFGLAQIALLAVLATLFLIAFDSQDSDLVRLVGFVCAVLLIPMAWAGWAVASQRCRDFGWTGWATLITLIPYAGWLFTLAIMFIPGTQGSNRYGPDPLGPGAPGFQRHEPAFGLERRLG